MLQVGKTNNSKVSSLENLSNKGFFSKKKKIDHR